MFEQVLSFRAVSPLVKARMDDNINSYEPYHGGTALRGDRMYFSALISAPVKHMGARYTIQIESPIKEMITSYLVEQVPVRLPHYPDRFDGDYIEHKPSLLPDLLRPANDVFRVMGGVLQQLYFAITVPTDAKPGTYPVKVILNDQKAGEAVADIVVNVEILDALLPKQELRCTQWFHYDCLATYYNVEVFSERHWEIIENFLTTFVDQGNNVLLTPVFTPPLDTLVGGERPTVQLVDVIREKGKYCFGFDKLKRFCDMCLRLGIEELEIAHFFTQWGAEHAPKIMATDNGVYRRIFGWESDSTGEDYVAFLRTFIPALKEKLDEFGYKDHYFFHISDEPNTEHLEKYTQAKANILDLISDHPVRDALSHLEFYQQGVVTSPVPCVDRAEPFIEAKVPDLWVYYCCGQSVGCSNRFLAMPGYRTRVLGAQLFKADIKGFLQWGYNYYYSQYSINPINPYLVNDGDFFVPAGDAFSVYPDNDGKPLLTLHGVLFEQALLDQRALAAAANKVGREKVSELIDSLGKVDFMHYLRSETYVLSLREQANRLATQ